MFSRFQKGTWVIKADGADQRQIAVEARHAVWSPGSGRAAYTNHHLDGIYVMGADGSYKRRRTTDGGTFPQWSPNGTRIVYTSRQLDEIWVMDTNGGDQKQLTTDGAHIAYTSRSGIWLMDPDGSKQRHLPLEYAKGPVWSPDSTRVAYTSRFGGIYVVDTNGANQKNRPRRVRSDLVTQRRPHRLHGHGKRLFPVDGRHHWGDSRGGRRRREPTTTRPRRV